MGLGRAARMTLGLVERNRIPVEIVDVEFEGLSRTPLESTALVGNIDAPRYSATLLQMNPEQVVDGLLTWDEGLLGRMQQSYIAAIPFWELSTLPDHWVDFLRGVDEVLAPSRHIEEVIRAAFSTIENPPRLSYYLQAVRPPSRACAQRRRWFGDRSETTVFLASFDLVSDPARKNPGGALAAFLAASAHRDDMTLVLKAGYANMVSASPEYRALAEAAASDPRILLIEETLDDSEAWSLLASSDAYVSLHRAEGLGLGLMESMALGKPVIGTSWSGNMDFMSPEDSILVPYRLVPVMADQVPLYREMNGTAVWADPDIAFAAQAMRQLAESPETRTRLGRAARESSERRWLEYSQAQALRGVLAHAANPDLASSLRVERLARLRSDVRARAATARRNVSLAERSKRIGVAGLRAVGLKPPAPADEVGSGPLRIVDPYEVDV